MAHLAHIAIFTRRFNDSDGQGLTIAIIALIDVLMARCTIGMPVVRAWLRNIPCSSCLPSVASPMPLHRHGAATASCPGMPRKRLADTPEGRAFLAAADTLDYTLQRPPEPLEHLNHRQFRQTIRVVADILWARLCSGRPDGQLTPMS